MPWFTSDLQELVVEAKKVVSKYYSISEELKVFLCTSEEMIKKVVKDIDGLPLKESLKKRIIRYVVPGVGGKFFSLSEEIWLVEGRGDNLPDLIHEILHSIQKCSPNREGIVEYITYKLTKDAKIQDSMRKDWHEIERQVGFKEILKRLISKGDCEDF